MGVLPVTYGELICAAIMALKSAGYIVCVRINNGPNISVRSCEGSILTWCSYADDPWEEDILHEVDLNDKDVRTVFIENAGLHPNAQPR
jgi:hypothetical protein